MAALSREKCKGELKRKDEKYCNLLFIRWKYPECSGEKLLLQSAQILLKLRLSNHIQEVMTMW